MKCTGKNCPMQVGYDVTKCVATDCYYRTEPQTNADRIRAMTDEELGVLLADGFPEYACNYECFDNKELHCKGCILKWLKKEVEE